MPGLMHWVSVQQAAGVEAHFLEFIEQSLRDFPDWHHVLLNPQRSVHPHLDERLRRSLTHSIHSKSRWGIPLPAHPSQLRGWHVRRESLKAGARTGLIWNRTSRSHFFLNALGAENCIHWEHGDIWHPGRERERSDYLRKVPLAITNSRASARVMQLMWGYDGALEVCLNALRPTMMPAERSRKSFPSNRPIRLGMAARLMPVKGVPVVLQAFKLLADGGMDVELHIAGAGPERDAVQALAKKLGVEDRCYLLGSISEMQQFYQHIDCLVHPPLTEAFGLVSIEAAANGCPVIVSAIDGLPEAVTHGVSGICVEATLPLSDYEALGSSLYGIPEQVYDPINDTLCAPKVVDPSALARSVQDLFSESATYEGLSASASLHVAEKFRFDDHVAKVMKIIFRFVRDRR
jgi:glycosyltransferase involved in cell wall biosynthesis